MLFNFFILKFKMFEDLDEIIARYIQPMASNARDLLNHKYYKETGGDKTKMEKLIKAAKEANRQRIPYFMSCCQEKACGNAAVDGKF